MEETALVDYELMVNMFRLPIRYLYVPDLGYAIPFNDVDDHFGIRPKTRARILSQNSKYFLDRIKMYPLLNDQNKKVNARFGTKNAIILYFAFLEPQRVAQNRAQFIEINAIASKYYMEIHNETISLGNDRIYFISNETIKCLEFPEARSMLPDLSVRQF